MREGLGRVNTAEIVKELDNIAILAHERFMHLSKMQHPPQQEFFFAMSRIIDDVEWLKEELKG